MFNEMPNKESIDSDDSDSLIPKRPINVSRPKDVFQVTKTIKKKSKPEQGKNHKPTPQ
jgi:hypothetical protein